MAADPIDRCLHNFWTEGHNPSTIKSIVNDDVNAQKRRSLLISGLSTIMYLNTLELLDTQHRSLSTLAFGARNIVEIHAWLTYFNRYPAKTDVFVKDLAREWHDLFISVKKDPEAPDHEVKVQKVEAALKNLAGILKLSSPAGAFIDISEAKKELVPTDRLTHKLLSKLGHVTAVSVLTASSPNVVEDLGAFVLDDAVDRIGECCRLLECLCEKLGVRFPTSEDPVQVERRLVEISPIGLRDRLPLLAELLKPKSTS